MTSNPYSCCTVSRTRLNLECNSRSFVHKLNDNIQRVSIKRRDINSSIQFICIFGFDSLHCIFDLLRLYFWIQLAIYNRQFSRFLFKNVRNMIVVTKIQGKVFITKNYHSVFSTHSFNTFHFCFKATSNGSLFLNGNLG